MNKTSLLIFDTIKKTSILNNYNSIRKYLKFEKSDLIEYQLKKIKQLLIHAQNNSNYYKDLFNKIKFDAYQFTKLQDLEKIPILTRQILQENWQNIHTSDKKIKTYKGASSGSTGIPITYFYDTNSYSSDRAAALLGWNISGWEFGLKGLHIWGNPSTVNIEWKRISSKLKAFVFRHHKFPAYQLTDGKSFKFLFDKINKERYDFIDGYTNAIFLLSEYIHSNGLKLNKRLKIVLTTAENLHDFQRVLIEKELGPVLDSYGCSEINAIAYECAFCRNYHIIDPHIYIEYGDKLDNDNSSKLIITDLDNYSFPFIRYQNDDIAIPLLGSENKCIIKFESLIRIIGRESDILRFRDGGMLSVPSFFGSMLLKEINGIIQYQIEKDSYNHININLVVSKDFSNKDSEIIKAALNEYLAGKIDYNLCFVNNISISKNGKHKLLIDKTN